MPHREKSGQEMISMSESEYSKQYLDEVDHLKTVVKDRLKIKKFLQNGDYVTGKGTRKAGIWNTTLTV